MAYRAVTDYAGNELSVGDIVCYATRVSKTNTVRMTDAEILKIKAEKAFGKLVIRLKVQPTGYESGFTARRSLRSTWIGLDHVRLAVPAEVLSK